MKDRTAYALYCATSFAIVIGTCYFIGGQDVPVVPRPREPEPPPHQTQTAQFGGHDGNYDKPAELRDLPTNAVFVFAGNKATDLENYWRVVGPPLPQVARPDGTADTVFGIGYQPTRDGNSVYVVHVASGVLYRAQASMKGVMIPDVKVTVRIRDRWTYGKVVPE